MLLNKSEYEADKERVLNSVIAILDIAVKLRIVHFSDPRMCHLTEEIDKECKNIAKVYKEREDEIRAELDRMADEYGEGIHETKKQAKG